MLLAAAWTVKLFQLLVNKQEKEGNTTQRKTYSTILYECFLLYSVKAAQCDHLDAELQYS